MIIGTKHTKSSIVNGREKLLGILNQSGGGEREGLSLFTVVVVEEEEEEEREEGEEEDEEEEEEEMR